MRYAVGGRAIFDGLNLTARRGRITAFMGPSGTGKTTLLRLITGQVYCRARQRASVRRRSLDDVGQATVRAAPANGHAVPERRAAHRSKTSMKTSRFRCARIPDLPESLIRQLVLTKLHAVGLRGAARLMPAELSGGMQRRVALARAIVMDPDILIYDEPFVGLDPISMGVICRLIKQMNEALGITSIVVSHDVQELVDHCARQFPAVVGQGGGLGYSRRTASRASSKKCASSWAVSPTVRCRSTIRRLTTSNELLEVDIVSADRRFGCRSQRCAASAP